MENNSISPDTPAVDVKSQGYQSPETENTTTAQITQMNNVTDKTVPVGALKKHPLIQELFPIEEGAYSTLAKLTEDMKNEGFNPLWPILVVPVPEVPESYYIVDGYTRFQAAIENNIVEIPIRCKPSSSCDEMLNDAVKAQFIRRNKSDSLILRYVIKTKDVEAEKANKRKGQRNDLNTSGQPYPEDSGRTAEIIAKQMNSSSTTVKHAIAILTNKELREKVLDGTLSINKAYNTLLKQRKTKAAVTTAQGIKTVKIKDDDTQDIDYTVESDEELQDKRKCENIHDPVLAGEDDEDDMPLSFYIKTSAVRKILALIANDRLEELKAIAEEACLDDLIKLISERISHVA